MELQPATSRKFSSPGTNAGPPGAWTTVSKDGQRPQLAGPVQAAPSKKFHSMCVQCKVILPARDHSTIRATFMWDRSIMCLWNFC